MEILSGFRGVHCDADINECEQTPDICGNGTCFNYAGDFRCECPVGFEGFQCLVVSDNLVVFLLLLKCKSTLDNHTIVKMVTLEKKQILLHMNINMSEKICSLISTFI